MKPPADDAAPVSNSDPVWPEETRHYWSDWKFSPFVAVQKWTCFPGGSDSKESACLAGNLVSIPVLGKFPVEGMATHSSILAQRIPWTGEPGWLHTVHGIAKSLTYTALRQFGKITEVVAFISEAGKVVHARYI